MRRPSSMLQSSWKTPVPIVAGALIGFWIGWTPVGTPLVEAQTAPPATVQPAPINAAPASHPYQLHIPAPPLGGGEWVNVEKPLSLADLRGRFVLLDFWTYCCINCMHVLPELKKLEHAFPIELVVIGIHSAKFAGEQVTDNIREAARRYEIEHPIVNDAQMAIWQRYGARSWPTLVLIDPAGEVVWAASGERDFDEMKAVIDRGLPYYRETGLLVPSRRPAILADSQQHTTPLRFPGKVLADGPGKRLFIADSNHNRIVVVDFSGKVLLIIGSGAAGRIDGRSEQCSFNHPQGMALVGDALYVADTENHLLRKVDLVDQRVTTVAGTGERGSGWPGANDTDAASASPNGDKPRFRGLPAATPLASPWALWHHGDYLYIAMAGTHQIWRMPLDESEIGPFAGNGREDISDGPLLPTVPYDARYAAFAQPSGLASDGKRLFVADSEGSTVRSLPMDGGGEVSTLVGLTGTLFDFGDIDGKGGDVRLQHPLGVAWQDGKLYVADTYNNKIKVIDADTRECRTIAGSDTAGGQDADEGLQASFNEPTGLAAANGKLYVADTNNHAIRVLDLQPPYRVATLNIAGLSTPSATE